MMKFKELLTVTAFFLLATNVYAAVQEGTDYTVLAKPIPQLQADKVEVLEFFGYTCIHCYHLDQFLLKHAQAFPSDTYLRTEHVVWGDEMLGLARIAAAVNVSGEKFRANPAVFDAIFEKKINLDEPAAFKQWAAQQKTFNSQKVLSAFDGFSNQAEAKKMQQLTNDYKISSTPVVIVGGKYQVEFKQGWENGMRTIDELVQKVRTDRGMKAPVKSDVPVKSSVKMKSKGAAIAKSANR